MGLYPVKIRFEKGVPSFQAISQQYKKQTALIIRVVALVHLATSEIGEMLGDAFRLLPLLQADADLLAANNARYEAAKALLLSDSQYEKLAALRDQAKVEKSNLNYVEEVLLMVGFGLDFHMIEVSVEGQVITVNKYLNEHYAVNSLIKSLVDLGGKCQFNGKDELPKSWQKLKQWGDYKWYNRPKK